MTKYWVKSKIWSLQHQAEFEPGAEVELDGDMAELVADGVLQEIDPAQPGDIAVVDDAVPNDLPADIAESGDGSGRRKKKNQRLTSLLLNDVLRHYYLKRAR